MATCIGVLGGLSLVGGDYLQALLWVGVGLCIELMVP